MVSVGSETDVNKLLSAYKSEGNPDLYKDTYADLLKFVENSLDIYKVILRHFIMILFQTLKYHVVIIVSA